MEPLEFKLLIDKYFEGFTSIEEERKIHKFLISYSGNDRDILEAKVLFTGLKKHSEETVVLDFETVLRPKLSLKNRKIYAVLSGIAASLIIILSLTFLLKTNNPKIVYAYVNGQAITNKQEAMQYSQHALLTISSNLNKGTQGLNYINKLNKPVELLTSK